MTSDLERLARPFPAKYVKPPAQGKYGDYVDHEIVNQALLLILGPFSFQVQQVFYNAEGLLDGCTAALTAIVDGREVTITEAGDCEHAAQKHTQGERLKNAASDALKRCAMRMGCGLHLWAGNDHDYFLYEQLKSLSEEGSVLRDSARAVKEADAPSRIIESSGAPLPAISDAPAPEPPGDAPAASALPVAVSANQINQLQAKISALNAIKGFAFSERRKAAGLPLLTKAVTPEVFADFVMLVAQCEEELHVRSGVA